MDKAVFEMEESRKSGCPSGRERIGSPVKPPQGALFSRHGTERCGKDKQLAYQVRFKEVKEMRLNHRRGTVKVIRKYLKSKSQYDEEQSLENVIL